jgi:hypothetical protein
VLIVELEKGEWVDLRCISEVESHGQDSFWIEKKREEDSKTLLYVLAYMMYYSKKNIGFKKNDFREANVFKTFK